ncbi:DUF2868 domain-containing protein [Sedimenticola selenatireducens]|uniref:DUF2868 domain-containing protein n=1 Tax=Sedimenticola selenatireducens TaxID=191960 RepID=A0A558DUM5_9GAMM|nr:DUF2868 domain-containing protein [Sedimenticola selenatireducens]TVO72496.1 DUF2868 domain-containing protein [Sedimenticola selenatireducens]TVT64751.1 MAG: DUF2868 domain-containing protein [Sedimenticola selenatireducens]
MSIWERSILLILLRRRLETERTTDWQVLHKRDRRWFLAQPESNPWLVLRDWLAQWDDARQGSVGLFVYGLGFAVLVLGFVLVAGLVEFLTFERINLLWFMLIAILLPFAWWVGALFFSSAQVPIPLRTLFQHRLPSGALSKPLTPLLKLTVVALGQQLSMLFSLGMLMAFLLYLLVTDLAFGWSSTLNLSSELIYQLTHIMSWPWQNLWPAAVPSIELVEQTHYFRAAPISVVQPELFGQWWRFLLMSLLLYVVLPRVITSAFFRYRLNRMQGSVRKSDALIGGLWQRLATELIDHEAQPVEQREPSSVMPITEEIGVTCRQILAWGVWPDDVMRTLRLKLGADGSGVYWVNIDSPKAAASTAAELKSLVDAPLLLLCKGWEPPTGELEDYCNMLGELRAHLFLWPVPLTGMDERRQKLLIESWRSFMGQLPECFHLIINPLAAEKRDA